MNYTLNIFHTNDIVYVNCESYFMWMYDEINKEETLLTLKSLGEDNNFIWKFVKEHKNITGKFVIADKISCSTVEHYIMAETISELTVRQKNIQVYKSIKHYIQNEFYNTLYYIDEEVTSYSFTTGKNLRLTMGDVNKFIKFDELIKPEFKDYFHTKPKPLQLPILKLSNYDDKLDVLMQYLQYGVVKYNGFFVNSVEFTKNDIIISCGSMSFHVGIDYWCDFITLERI